jgi:hydrogenase nickel incorporation protein HypA/HybF
MHEVGLAYELLKLASDTAKKNGATEILRVGVAVGSLSGVEPTSLAFALESLKGDTEAKNADIEMDVIKAVGKCLECGKTSVSETFFSQCDHCGSPTLEIIEGDKLFLKYIDV